MNCYSFADCFIVQQIYLLKRVRINADKTFEFFSHAFIAYGNEEMV